MSQTDDNSSDHDSELEAAAAKGRLPGLDEVDLAEREGRDPSGTPDSSEAVDSDAPDTASDGQTDDDAPAGGVVMGAINQH